MGSSNGIRMNAKRSVVFHEARIEQRAARFTSFAMLMLSMQSPNGWVDQSRLSIFTNAFSSVIVRWRILHFPVLPARRSAMREENIHPAELRMRRVQTRHARSEERRVG